ncbi:MAG: hypothetical protein IPO37_17870 [Saprospiraceae bacterium]|nr:hypothetical protein [Saprospiraceae bacterium]
MKEVMMKLKIIDTLEWRKKQPINRYILLKFLGTNYNEGKENLCLQLKTMLRYLFPDGSNWREVRDLVLQQSIKTP